MHSTRALSPVVLFNTVAAALSVCDQLLAGTWQFLSQRDLGLEANTTCPTPPRESEPTLNIYESNPTTSSNSPASSPNLTSSTNETVLWLIKDVYEGNTFFETWDFWNNSDPTQGTVTYVNRSYAFANNLSAVPDNGQVMMKGDDRTRLSEGANRSSVRISSQKRYNSGSLFILDVVRAPWGCGVWSAFQTVGDNWPAEGEVDIIQGAHDNQHNQVAWHAAPGCNYTTTANYTGTLNSVNNVTNVQCNACINNNSGCSVDEWSHASYGEYFDSTGGGVYATKWDNDSIAVWTFYRSAIPEDITSGSPDPSKWGIPSAVLTSGHCDIEKFFRNHAIVFDITFCGSAYPRTCPGTCAQRIMDPSNFVNATWVINSLRVYEKTVLSGPIVHGNEAWPRGFRGDGTLLVSAFVLSVGFLYA